MPQISPIVWPFAVLALVALPATAQVNTPPAATAASPAPNAIAAASIALPYRSVFNGYQPFSEEKVKPWKDTNSTVEKIGGWRAYAKEAAEPAPADTQAPAAPTAPSVNPHSAHGKP